MASVRVLLVDDEAVERGALVEALRARGIDASATAGDVLEAESLVGIVGSDVVLLALRLPPFAFLEAVRRLVELWGDVPVVALVPSPVVIDVVETIEAGAAGYVTRADDIEVVAATVRAVSRGELGVSRRAARVLARRLADWGSASARFRLSEREWQVWSLLARGLGNREIAEKLGLSLRTAEDHVYRLCRALGVRGRAAAVELYRRGVERNDAGDAAAGG